MRTGRWRLAISKLNAVVVVDYLVVCSHCRFDCCVFPKRRANFTHGVAEEVSTPGGGLCVKGATLGFEPGKVAAPGLQVFRAHTAITLPGRDPDVQIVDSRRQLLSPGRELEAGCVGECHDSARRRALAHIEVKNRHGL
jgi:hypothetical protein